MIPTTSDTKKQLRAHVALLTGMRNKTGTAYKLSTKDNKFQQIELDAALRYNGSGTIYQRAIGRRNISKPRLRWS